MNRKYFFFILLPLFLKGIPAAAQSTDSLYLDISSIDGYHKTFRNFERIYFLDSIGHKVSGKLYILNDSQFCFVNYFNEASGSIYHINDIYEYYLTGIKGKGNGPGKRRVIPLGLTIVACVLPYTSIIALPYLLISEIIRSTKKLKNGTSPSSGWTKRPVISVKIKGGGNSA